MNRKTIKNIALAVSLLAFAIGFTDADESLFYLGRPVGSILFAVFMIFTVLEKETDLLDEQTKASDNEIKISADNSAPSVDSRKTALQL